MITEMGTKNLEAVSDTEAKEALLFVNEISRRFRNMTEMARDMNYRTDQCIRDFYSRSNSRGYAGRS